VGNGSRLIAGITLTDQGANVPRYSVLASTTLQRHDQYRGRRGFFFPATSVTQRATGGTTRLRTDMTRPASPLRRSNQNLTGTHLPWL